MTSSKDKTKEDVISAARITGLHEEILNLPDVIKNTLKFLHYVTEVQLTILNHNGKGSILLTELLELIGDVVY